MSESIYNLIEKPKQDVIKKPIYRSKYDPKAPLTGSTFGLHGTYITDGKGVHDLKRVSRNINSENEFKMLTSNQIICALHFCIKRRVF